MGKIFELKPKIIETINEELEEGILYVSEIHGIAIHLCACGCKQKTVTDLHPRWKDGWLMSNNDGLITFTPIDRQFYGRNPISCSLFHHE